eukprot:scaffold31369_cov48-Tisochrysis_lutea.AAC.1
MRSDHARPWLRTTTWPTAVWVVTSLSSTSPGTPHWERCAVREVCVAIPPFLEPVDVWVWALVVTFGRARLEPCLQLGTLAFEEGVSERSGGPHLIHGEQRLARLEESRDGLVKGRKRERRQLRLERERALPTDRPVHRRLLVARGGAGLGGHCVRGWTKRKVPSAAARQLGEPARLLAR